MKAAILPIVWLAATCGASAAPLDLQTEPGVPSITATFMLADDSAAIDFFEAEKRRGAAPERDFAQPILIWIGCTLIAAAALTPLGKRIRKTRRAARRRCKDRRRQMAWI